MASSRSRTPLAPLDSPKGLRAASPTKGNFKTPVALKKNVLDKRAKPAPLDFLSSAASETGKGGKSIFDDIAPGLEPTVIKEDRETTRSRVSSRPGSPKKGIRAQVDKKEEWVKMDSGRKKNLYAEIVDDTKDPDVQEERNEKEDDQEAELESDQDIEEQLLGRPVTSSKTNKRTLRETKESAIAAPSADSSTSTRSKLEKEMEVAVPQIQKLSLTEEEGKEREPLINRAKEAGKGKKRRMTIITIHDTDSDSHSGSDSDAEEDRGGDEQKDMSKSQEIIKADDETPSPVILQGLPEEQERQLGQDDIIIEETPPPPSREEKRAQKKSVSPDPQDSPLLSYSPPPSSKRPSPRSGVAHAPTVSSSSNSNIFSPPSRARDQFATPSPQVPRSAIEKNKENGRRRERERVIVDLSSSDDEGRTRSSPRKRATASAITRPASPSKSSFTSRRDALATSLIQDLERRVFKPHGKELPDGLKLVWNKRLNTTAGRANWKRITRGSGEQLTVENKVEIELSTKVIDSEEKLGCTLSHELCHVAAWIFENEKNPPHGPAFKMWAKRIMTVRKDIKVSTTHDYEIRYKYRWRCTNPNCEKIYGRHSKSIDPAKHACGVCQGLLVEISAAGEVKSSSPRKRSEYQEFLSNNLKRMKEKHPALAQGEVMKLLAQEWKNRKAKENADVDDLGNMIG
ncbi:hypothetical protein BT69DRAFT_1346131, partial [Atractiella rhizophila]